MSSQTSVAIHPQAIVHPNAQLDSGVVVGPFCVVGAHVKIGRGTVLHSHVVVEGHTTLGAENQVFPFASVGHAPQDLKYRNEPTELIIGDRNRIREGATLQPGTVQDLGKTLVGSGNLFMAYTHVAHDCIIGDENILANAVQLAGHVIVENRAVLGSMSAVHQFCRVGELAMVGANAMVTQDMPPFCNCHGDRAVLRGLNLIGLKRKGYSSETNAALKKAYALLFSSGYPTVEQAVEKCDEEGLSVFEPVAQLIAFVRQSKRGVLRPTDGSVE
jgi:UDP-N-acetylglucosamine acyltransferase